MKNNLMLALALSSLAMACHQHPVPEPGLKPLEDTVIVVPARVSVPEGSKHYVPIAEEGTVHLLEKKPGERVEKGQVLAYLFNVQYLEKQNQYLSLKYQLAYLASEMKRQGELTVDNVVSIKKLEQVQAEFLAADAQVQGLGKMLETIGFDTDIIEKKGPMKYAYLLAPATGVLHYGNLAAGQFLGKGDQGIFIRTNNSIQINIMIPLGIFKDIPYHASAHIFLNDSLIHTTKIKDCKWTMEANHWIAVTKYTDPKYLTTSGEILMAKIHLK
jgi:multidrug efflux pump subunit AcrA (membrane-fusion protein)